MTLHPDESGQIAPVRGRKARNSAVGCSHRDRLERLIGFPSPQAKRSHHATINERCRRQRVEASSRRRLPWYTASLAGKERCLRHQGAGVLDRRQFVSEATGGYIRARVQGMTPMTARISRINPRQVCDFARARGKLATTDAIDAGIILRFAKAMQPRWSNCSCHLFRRRVSLSSTLHLGRKSDITLPFIITPNDIEHIID